MVPPTESDESNDRETGLRGPTAFELLGRDADLNALAAQVGTLPLVSIVGAGGVGKTSLARAVLAHQSGPWRDGVHWIELAPLQDGAQIAFRMAQSLNVELGPAAQARESLLGDVAALVRDAIERAPAVRWLATSQEPLRIPVEKVYRLDTLAVPQPGTPLATALGYGAWIRMRASIGAMSTFAASLVCWA